MIAKQKWMIIALLIPLIALAGLVVKSHYRLVSGKEIILPISGYDPRNLISGHYLVYRIEYGAKEICNPLSYNQAINDTYYCVESKKFTSDKPTVISCRLYIKGRCQNGHFVTGIEQFYIPEKYAKDLSKVVFEKRGKIIVRVTNTGETAVKNLLIDNKPWEDFVKKPEKNK